MRRVRSGIETLQNVGMHPLHLHLVHQPHQRRGEIEGGGLWREVRLALDERRDELCELQLAAEPALGGDAIGRADELDRRDEDRRMRVEGVPQPPSHPAGVDEDARSRQQLRRLTGGQRDEAARDERRKVGAGRHPEDARGDGCVEERHEAVAASDNVAAHSRIG